MNDAAFRAGKVLRCQYISTVPPEAYEAPGEFFLGLFGDYPLAYATKPEVALALVDVLNHELRVGTTMSEWMGHRLWRVTPEWAAWTAFRNTFADYSI